MAGKFVVVKIGGSTLGSHDTTLADLVTLQKQGTIPVVVHGGGKVISQWMERLGTAPSFIRGLRVTDGPTLEVVTAVLTGLVNKQLVASLISLGAECVGMSGVDGGLLEARIPDPKLGFVGEVVKVNPKPVFQALEAGYIPMVAPVGIHTIDGSPDSGVLLNINWDTAAGEIAWALEASNLIFLTDVEGVMDPSGRVLGRLTARQGRVLISSGVIKSGMIPKVEACLRALERVPQADIVDGRQPGALLGCLEGRHHGTRLVP